jgi:uncharacterized protein
MSKVTKYQPGTPCWVELATTDLDSAKAFYSALLGWKDYSVGPPEAGYYTMPERDGLPIAGMSTQQDAERAAGVPPHWNTYISVESADATTKKVAGLGGTVVAEPFDVMDVGRMAVYLDPDGAAIAVWQPKVHVGAGVVNEVGAWGWSELYTRDVDQAIAFYGGLFGWGTKRSPEYTEWLVGDRSVGGMIEIRPEMGPVPPNWTTYFQIDDCDAAAATAKDKGGSVMMPPMDIPDIGRFAVVADAQGAVFAIIKTAEGVTG